MIEPPTHTCTAQVLAGLLIEAFEAGLRVRSLAARDNARELAKAHACGRLRALGLDVDRIDWYLP